jgi:hypothetical protein
MIKWLLNTRLFSPCHTIGFFVFVKSNFIRNAEKFPGGYYGKMTPIVIPVRVLNANPTTHENIP